jgi:hypothetical protein
MSDLDFLTGRRASGDLAPLYDAIALPPDRWYGIDSGADNDRGYAFNQWLPFTTNRVGSTSWVADGADPQWSLPQVAREALKGYVDLANATQTGSLTPEALASFTSGAAGAGLAGAPRGALAAGGARPSLPALDPAAMERARRMGFNVDRPLFHGTDSTDFRSFRAVPPWQAIRAGRSPGLSLAEDLAVANKLAEPGVRSLLGLSPTSRSQGSPAGLPRIYPLFARSDKETHIGLRPGDDWGDIWRTVAGTFDDGYDAVHLSNYRMFPELGPQTNWMVRDPSQLRSWFARFDPSRRGSDDLLAARVTPGFKVTQPSQPGLRIKAGRAAADMEF